MSSSPVTLVDVPRSLRQGLSRRLPRGNRFKDLTGTEYRRSVVIGFAGYKGAFAAWLCRCKCGTLFLREGAVLARPDRQGCGCSMTKKSPIPKYIRVAWRLMKARCYDRCHRDYGAYGQRGIRVCRRWLTSVERFAEDMGPRPSPQHIIARKNKDGNFTLRNCFWGTLRDRQVTTAREVTYRGKTHCLAAWADKLGISREAMRYRVDECLRRGIKTSFALTTPLYQRLPKK